jgi:cyanophycin synthetase
MKSHRCSKDHEGGFFERVDEGTWMGHVIEHIALEIQSLAGMEVGFGRTRGTGAKGVYNVVFSYMEENVGTYAAKTAVAIADALVKGEEFDLNTEIKKMRRMREQDRFGPSTGSIVDEAVARDIPFIRLNKESLIQLGYGKNQVRFRATMTDRTSSIAVDLASNKDETKRLLQEAAIPVAKGMCISQEEQVKEVIDSVKFPLVFKPLAYFHHAKKYSYKIIVEKFITGYDFRVLVINNRFIAAALREPAHVIGDGRASIQELIDTENKDPRRGYGHENVLTEISIDKETTDQLAKFNYTLETVV